MKTLLKLFIVIMPWAIKRFLLQKCFGYKLSKKAHIGLSFVFPKYLEMHDGAQIGHLNVIINCDKVVVGENSLIVRDNWITGFPSGTDSPHFAHDPERRSELIMGREAVITKKHHVDCTGRVIIGDFVSIGGYNTQIMSHAVDMYQSRQDSHPIVIGNYAYIGTGAIILGGATLPAYSMLAAGAVLSKNYTEEWKIYGGVPAKPIKDIPHDAKYFSREKGFIY